MIGLDALLGWTIAIFFAGALGVAVVWYYGHSAQRRAEVDRAAKEAESAQQHEAALDAHHQEFGAFLCPWAADNIPLNPRAPINVEVYETGTWIHGVRFSWRYRTDTAWRTAEKTCDRWGQDQTMPVAVNAADEVGFSWPGDLPPRQAALTWKVDIDWALSRHPPVRRFEGLEGSTNWQTN